MSVVLLFLYCMVWLVVCSAPVSAVVPSSIRPVWSKRHYSLLSLVSVVLLLLLYCCITCTEVLVVVAVIQIWYGGHSEL